MAMEIVPSIDLRNGQVVRLAQGDYDRQTTYPLDPLEVAKRYADAGARWLHIVDLDGAKEGRPAQVAQVEAIVAASGLRAQVGGGVRGTADLLRLLDAGVERVVVGTRAMEAWDWFEQTVKTPGMQQRLVLAIDAKDGLIATKGWTQTTTRRAVDVARQVSDWPLAALLYTDVAKDGMLQGPNLEQTGQVARVSKVPVIASGGVGSLEHIRGLLPLGVWGVIVGRSLYEGKLDLAEAIAIAAGER